MADDPVVMEVRRIREEHAARFDDELGRIFADFKKSEQQRDASKSPLLMPPERTVVRSQRRAAQHPRGDVDGDRRRQSDTR